MKLFSWVDVDAAFEKQKVNGNAPEWLVGASAFWETLEIDVADNVNTDDIIAWLSEVFGRTNLVEEEGDWFLLLEGETNEGERRLHIEICVTDSRNTDVNVVDSRPLWADNESVNQSGMPASPLPVPVVAFHSYKGGVGRTLHAFAAAKSLSNAGKVLLIDGDLEAPGLSWMYKELGLGVDISYEDFIALAHHSNDGTPSLAVKLAEKFIRNQEIGNIYFLPSRRDLLSVKQPKIQPPNLLVHSRSPFYLTESLSALAERLEVSCVVVDLRAGASELSSQLLLDPRVTRVFVTTASAQSLSGVGVLIKEVMRRAPARSPGDPTPRIVLTQFRPEATETALSEMLEPILQQLSAIPQHYEGTPDVTSEHLLSAPVLSKFREDLLHLPSDWQSVSDLVDDTSLPELMNDIVADIIASNRSNVESLDKNSLAFDLLNEKRASLADFANTLAYAETADVQEFLATNSLKKLVSSHRTELPICVATGAKGAGKTFTQLQMLYRRSWTSYANDVGVDDVSIDAKFVPVLTSKNLGDAVTEKVKAIREEVRAGVDSVGGVAILDLIHDSLVEDLTPSEWRKIWLVVFGRSLGLECTVENVESVLSHEAVNGERVVFVIDGLEDILQEISDDKKAQLALRALLQDVLEWFRAIRGRPFGIVIFVRRDLVRAAFPQNAAQFLARYQAFQLSWNETEALRLAAWVAKAAGVIDLTEHRIEAMDDAALTALMKQVWGDKLGTAKSREAKSRRWFTAALSDFNGSIQPRDIVTFMSKAARGSIDDNKWSDRLLIPSAMRSALVGCSEQKITAISEETPAIGRLLSHLHGLPDEARQVPISRGDMGLEFEQLQLLEENGVVFREEDKFWIPEIFRHGLGFRAVGRPKILAVANLVRKRNNAG